MPSLLWIREAVFVLAVHFVPCSFSSAMAKPNSCKSPWVLGQLPGWVTSALLHTPGHWLFHFTTLFCLFLPIREGISWEAIDWMDNAECLDLIEKVSRYLWQFLGIIGDYWLSWDLPWHFLVLKADSCLDPLPIRTWKKYELFYP